MDKISANYNNNLYSNTNKGVNKKTSPKPNSVYTCKQESTQVKRKPLPKFNTIQTGDIAEIPDSILYNPIYKSQYLFLKNFPNLKFKVEDNKGINKKNATKEDVCLALYGKKVADKISNVGACYTGVKKAMQSSGIIKNYDEMPRGEAKDSIKYFDKHPEKFKKINVAKKDLKNLPAGRIVVYTNKNDAGHIIITNGNGQGMSSATDNMGWLDYKGKDAKYVVYELTDNWKYNPATKKLSFIK